MKTQPLVLPVLLAFSLAASAEEPSSFKLEEVVVKGKGKPTETEQRQQANVAKIVIPREELEKSGDLSVSDYLKQVPGLGPVGNKGKNIASGAPQIMVDGVVLTSGRERRMQLNRLSLDMIERIEVTRAPTAALSNESAGAVVNIVLKNTIRQALKAGFNYVVGEEASRVGGGINGQVGARQDDFSWLIVGSYYQRSSLGTTDRETHTFLADGTPNPWTRETSDSRGVSRNLNLTPKLTWQLNATDKLVIEPSISYSQNPSDSNRLLFDYPDTLTGSIRENTDSSQSTYQIKSEWLRKDGQAERTLRASAQRGNEESSRNRYNFDAFNAPTGSSSDKTKSHDWTIELGAQAKEPIAAGHLVTTGIEYGWHKLDESSNASINPEATAFDIAEHSLVAYAQDEWAMNDTMSLTPGLRFRHLERDSEDGAGINANASSSTFSPSVHYLWKLNETLNFRSSVSHILKPPSFSDLTTVISTGDGTQSRPDQSGNPDLKNETAWVYNLGLEQYLAAKAGVVSVNLFYRDLSNLIQRSTQLEAGRYVSRPVNIGDAAIWGVELDGRTKMDIIGLPDLTLRGNFVTQNSRAKDDTTGEAGRVGDLPNYSANLGADYEFTAQKLKLSANLRLSGKQNMGLGDLEEIKPQKYLSINAQKKLSKSLTLRMGGHNLLNQKTDRTVISYHPAPDQDQIASWQHSLETGTRSFYISLESIW